MVESTIMEDGKKQRIVTKMATSLEEKSAYAREVAILRHLDNKLPFPYA